MAKKAKKSILASVMSPVAEIAAGDITSEAKTDTAVKAEKIEVSEEIKYDDVCDKTEELTRLSKENSDLIDKIAMYIEEIDSLKEEYKNLKEECDNHLMKISTLSFENATLKAQIDEFANNKNLNVNLNYNNPPIQIRQSRNVPYTHQVNCNKNGYSDWN